MHKIFAVNKKKPFHQWYFGIINLFKPDNAIPIILIEDGRNKEVHKRGIPNFPK
jgi:hypothetical protein